MRNRALLRLRQLTLIVHEHARRDIRSRGAIFKRLEQCIAVVLLKTAIDVVGHLRGGKGGRSRDRY